MAALSLPFLPSLAPDEPWEMSREMVRLIGLQLTVAGRHHIPNEFPFIVVSNHRSALDAPVLMTALERNVAFACHQYMANVPVLRDIVDRFGAFPLETPRCFFRQAYQRLRRQQAIGIFPEGAKPMVTVQPPRCVNSFHRGFAHLALRMPVGPLAVLPVALVSDDKGFESPIPLQLLGWFDPNEPLFQQSGGHPIVFYRKVHVNIGAPIWITPGDRQAYRGRQGSYQAQELADACWSSVHDLLHSQTLL